MAVKVGFEEGSRNSKLARSSYPRRFGSRRQKEQSYEHDDGFFFFEEEAAHSLSNDEFG